MTACPIFQVFEAAKRVSTELDQLTDDIIARLKKAEPSLFKDAGEWEWEDSRQDDALTWVTLGGALMIPVAVKERGCKREIKGVLPIDPL